MILTKTMKGISILGACALATIGLAGFRGINPELEPQDMLGKTDSELEALMDPLAEDLAKDQSRRALREYRASKGLFSCEGDCVTNQRRYLQAERDLLSARQRRINARIAQRVRLRGIVTVTLTQAEKEAAAAARREARLADRNGFNLLTSEERNAARKAARKEEQAVLSRAHWAQRAADEAEAARLAAIQQAIFDRNQEKPCPADFTTRVYNSETRSYEGEYNYTPEENPAYYGIRHACWFQQVHADKAVVNAAMQAARRSEGFGTAQEKYVAVENNVCSPGKDIEQSACFAAAFEFRGRLFSTLQVNEGDTCGCYYDNYSGVVSYGTGSYEAGTCGENTSDYSTTFICNP